MIAAVYHSKAACVEVLRCVERQCPSWWTPSCTEFLRRVESVPLVTETVISGTTATATAPNAKVLILVEGLDGVGKSVVTQALVGKLGKSAQLLRTPEPALSNIREIFSVRDETTARAFYSAANYLAAWDAFHATGQRRFVVFDRWWCSTCAMALANSCAMTTLPAEGDDVYAWPQDLPPLDLGVLLHVEEHIRQARIRRRAPEDAEERRLSAQREMREVAMAAYRRFGLLAEVHVPTHGEAVNHILSLMTAKGLLHDAVPFTDEELAAMRRF